MCPRALIAGFSCSTLLVGCRSFEEEGERERREEGQGQGRQIDRKKCRETNNDIETVTDKYKANTGTKL